jgi:hypothetical protein
MLSPVMLKLILTMLVICKCSYCSPQFSVAHGQTKLQGLALTLLAVLIMLLSILWVSVDQYQPENQILMLTPSGPGGQTCTLT